ncbi:LacI family DNA-binding transcriptional regulator [Clostridium polynesiense]|uniref:LacI family DNA-binding transcriptional regulator n=1 Tax=Clostridium polynesiense TaxID=1325933 RepID=UPI00058F69B0|nr:LacI family DNA-binding transcriptional regulator [Clostridium polynesiense]
MSTIKDVAKLAGVSISTVSYVLNNKGAISRETKVKVLEAVKELDYRPNGHARNLKTKKSKIIALVLYDFDSLVYKDILRGMRDVAKAQGYEVIIIESGNGKDAVSRILSQSLVDGAIILSASIEDKMIADLASDNFPIVVLDRNLPNEYVSCVLIDNVRGAYQAVEHMNRKGFKRVGIITGPKDTYDSIKRLEGFKKAVKELDLENNPSWNSCGNFLEDGGYSAMLRLLESGNHADAYFCANDEMAIGAIKACRDKGLSVPQDIGIIGFDDIIICEYISPQITTLRRPSYESGMIAANNLIHSLKGETTSNKVILSPELIIRESC